MPCRAPSSHIALGPLLALAVATASAEAGAQSIHELEAARSLFAEAIHDQDEHQFEAALAKFRRVQQVRDTVPIRYQIGRCEESLGHFVQALGAFEGVTELGARDSVRDEVVKDAQFRADAVRKRISRIALAIAGRSAGEVEVKIDDMAVASGQLTLPIAVNPGEHVITASAAAARPFRSIVVVPAGGAVALTVSFDEHPAERAMNPAESNRLRADATTLPLAAPSTVVATRPPRPGTGDHARNAGRIGTSAVLIVAGVALGAGAVTLSAIRQSEINQIHTTCPANVCPSKDNGSVESARSLAQALGPPAIALGAAGVVALGTGAVLYLMANGPRPPARAASLGVFPAVAPALAGLAATGTF